MCVWNFGGGNKTAWFASLCTLPCLAGFRIIVLNVKLSVFEACPSKQYVCVYIACMISWKA